MKKTAYLFILLMLLPLMACICALAEEGVNLFWEIPFGSRAKEILDQIEVVTGERVRMDYMGNLMMKEEQKLVFLEYPLEKMNFAITDKSGLYGIHMNYFPLERMDNEENDKAERELLQTGIGRFLQMAKQMSEIYGEYSSTYIVFSSVIGEKYLTVPMTSEGNIDDEALIQYFIEDGSNFFIRINWKNIGLYASTDEKNGNQNYYFNLGIHVFDSEIDLGKFEMVDFSARNNHGGTTLSRFLDLPSDISQTELEMFLAEIKGANFTTQEYDSSAEYGLSSRAVYQAYDIEQQHIALRRIHRLQYSYNADKAYDSYGLYNASLCFFPIYVLPNQADRFNDIADEYNTIYGQAIEEYGAPDALSLEAENGGVIYLDPKKNIDWAIVRDFIEGSMVYKLVARFGNIAVIGEQKKELLGNTYIYETSVSYGRYGVLLPFPDHTISTDDEGRHLLFNVPFDISVSDIQDRFAAYGLRLSVYDSGGPYTLVYSENANKYTYFGSPMYSIFFSYDKENDQLNRGVLVMGAHVWDKEIAYALGRRERDNLMRRMIEPIGEPDQIGFYVVGEGLFTFDEESVNQMDDTVPETIENAESYIFLLRKDNIMLISFVFKLTETDSLYQWVNEIIYSSDPLSFEMIIQDMGIDNGT